MNKNDVSDLLKAIAADGDLKKEFLSLLAETLDLRDNQYHPLVFINGDPEIGEGTYIGLFSEINARKSIVRIGAHCDIASFVSLNVADSYKFNLGLAEEIERKPITLEDYVFVGSHSFIGGDTHIGHHSVIGAGTILINGGRIPPYSLVYGNRAVVKPGYFENQLTKKRVAKQ